MQYIIPILILLLLILVCATAWNSNTDRITDYDLYGVDAEEYLKEQVGKDYYNKYYRR